MKEKLLWLWQLPQNIIGWLLSRSATRLGVLGFIVYYQNWKWLSGVSLGNYIILPKTCYGPKCSATIKHEHGHQLQSRYLGPLYLIVIGLPSALGNLLARILPFYRKIYYKQPWERWADRLGHVTR